MAARVGLPQQALLASALACLPYPPLLPLPTYRPFVSASADAGLRNLRHRRPFAARAMSQRSEAAGSPYAAELAAAKKAVSLAARLCQTVQQEIVQSDVQSKADKSPVTVADYGSQILVSLVLNMEVTSGSFSMVAEEDSADLRKDGAEEILERITDLVNETLAEDASFNILLSQQGILSAIDSGKSEGGPSGRHWILDPIDGTKGFLRGGQYAIALALLDEGKLVLGVLGCPNLPLSSISNLNGSSSGDQVGALFSATIGCGAEEETYPGTVTQIAVLIADLYEEVLTHVSGVSLFLEPWVEPAETVFSKTTLIELSDDVLTSVGGVSLFLELDMDYDAEVLTQVSGLSLFLEQLMDTHHELEGEIDKSTCLDHGVGAVRVIPLVVPLAEGKFQLLLSKEMLHGSTDIATFLLPWDPGAWINFVPGMSGHVVISVFSTGKEGRETSHSVLAELPSWSRSGFSPGFHDQALNTRLLNFLHDKVQVEQFLRYVIEEVHDAERKRFFNTVLYGYFSEVVICLRLQKIASLICAASFIFSVHIFSSLLDPKRSASASYQAFRSNVSHEAFVSASPMAVDCMHVTLGNLLNLLDTCAAAHILPTTYGCLSTPLGKPRQKIVEFISVLLTVGSETVYLKNNLLLDSMGWEDNKAVVLCS